MSETESPVYCSNQCISAFLKVLPNVWKDKSHAKIWPNFCADHSRSYRAGNWNICRTFTHSPSEATSQNINKTRKMFIIVRNERLTRTGCSFTLCCNCLTVLLYSLSLCSSFLISSASFLAYSAFLQVKNSPTINKTWQFTSLLFLNSLVSCISLRSIRISNNSPWYRFSQISTFPRTADQTSQKDSAMTTHYMLKHTSVHAPVEASCSYCIWASGNHVDSGLH